MRSKSQWLTLTGMLVMLAMVPAAQRGTSAQAVSPLDTAALKGLKWRNIGPANTSGRISDIEVTRVPGAPDAIYLGTASGGVFKSVNNGMSWQPVFDTVDALISIGDVGVTPANPNLVWVGTGEANNRNSENWGDGVYKSVDGGRTWKDMGLKDTRHIGRIVIDPTDPNTVYVAAVGHLWGPNAERGVFKTTDGGASWKKVLYVDENTGATDIAMDPKDPHTLFAATYQRQRKAFGFNGRGPGSAIYRTYDGGANWTKLTNGLPSGDKGRIGLDIYRQNGQIVYATVEADRAPDGGVFRSTDRGESWQQVTTLNTRPSYYSQIRIDPKESNRVYMLGSNRGFYIADDGGKTFREVFSNVHSEDHALWVDPDDPNHLILGGDGGVSISWTRGEGQNWLFRENLPVGQFYEIGVDMRDPYYVCGGLQDNGVWCVPSATRQARGISNSDAYNIHGGDGFYASIDPKDPNVIFTEMQNGGVNRVDLRTLERQAVKPEKTKKDDPNYRWNWNSPIVMSSFDTSRLYMGANVVFKSTDRGVTWTAISPDLTTNTDPKTLGMRGTEGGGAGYGTLTTIGESGLDANVLYTGSDDGQLQVTRDGGLKWTNLTSRIPNLPAKTYVSGVVASAHEKGRVYATFDGHQNDDYRPYVYVSDDYGQTWRSLSHGLPETSVNRLREHPKNPRLLFIGHERGVHASINGGSSWVSLNTNLPAVPVDDLVVHPRENDLIIGTHGRSIWILDDLSPLEALTPDVVTAEQRLLPSKPARLLSLYRTQEWFGVGVFFAPNPEYGAGVAYYLRNGSDGKKMGITIRDAAGHVIRKLEGPGDRGLNRIYWDLRMEPPSQAEAGQGAGGGGGGPARGPTVLPGVYQVVVTNPQGGELKGQVTVEGDPRIVISDADRRQWHAALLDLYELQKTLAAVQTSVRRATDEVGMVRKRLTYSTPPSKDALDQVAKVAERVSQTQRMLDDHLGTVGGLVRAIEGYTGRPTPSQIQRIDWAFEDVAKLVEGLNQIMQTDVPALSTAQTTSARIAAPVRKR
jgi:photosystem II stability/assembly factor-like uncharacterized protein